METETVPKLEERWTRKRGKRGRGTPSSKKKRRQEDSTQLLKVLLSSPSLSVEQVEQQMAAELDSIAQVGWWECEDGREGVCESVMCVYVKESLSLSRLSNWSGLSWRSSSSIMGGTMIVSYDSTSRTAPSS